MEGLDNQLNSKNLEISSVLTCQFRVPNQTKAMSDKLPLPATDDSHLPDNASATTIGDSATQDQIKKTPVEQDLSQAETKTPTTPNLNNTKMGSNDSATNTLTPTSKSTPKSNSMMELPNESQDTFQSAFEEESELEREFGITGHDDHDHEFTQIENHDEQDVNDTTMEVPPDLQVQEQPREQQLADNPTKPYSAEATPVVETFNRVALGKEHESTPSSGGTLEKVKTLEDDDDGKSSTNTKGHSRVPTLTTASTTINNEINSTTIHDVKQQLQEEQVASFDDRKAFATAPVPPPNATATDDNDQHPTKSVTHLQSANDSVTSLNSVQPSVSSHLPGFKKWFSFSKSANNSTDNLFTFKQLTKNVQYNLLYSRFQTNEQDFKSKSPKDQDFVLASANSLRKTFNEIKTGIEYSNDEMLIQGIDWEFWSRVVNDYSTVVTKNSDELLRHITVGIPRELRGMVWQLICNSKSFVLEEFFRDGRLQSSDFESQIKRDLARTSFVTDSAVKAKADDLFDIIKAYSLYDMEVGYTQGMAFITVPLLMNMDASEAFCMLTKVMKNYGFRELYLPEMPGLHLKLYQFDRLIEDLLPELHLHLKRQGVRSSMYATQWFLTLFGYKFPLDMVLRIYDVVIVEGIESILKFAVNLMAKNEVALLDLKFDDLVTFLKDKLFFYYIENSGASSTKDGTTAAPRGLTDAYTNKEITSDTYRLDQFVKDSMDIEILPMTLRRYSSEYEEVNRLERERREEIEEVRSKNGYLTREIRTIEAAYATLNREHVEIANEMVQGKVQIATLQDENKELQEQIEEMTNRLQLLEKQSDTQIDFTGEISDNMGLEIQKTMQRNLEVMEENRNLEDALAALETQYADLKKELEHVKKTGKWGVKTFW